MATKKKPETSIEEVDLFSIDINSIDLPILSLDKKSKKETKKIEEIPKKPKTEKKSKKITEKETGSAG